MTSQGVERETELVKSLKRLVNHYICSLRIKHSYKSLTNPFAAATILNYTKDKKGTNFAFQTEKILIISYEQVSKKDFTACPYSLPNT